MGLQVEETISPPESGGVFSAKGGEGGGLSDYLRIKE